MGKPLIPTNVVLLCKPTLGVPMYQVAHYGYDGLANNQRMFLHYPEAVAYAQRLAFFHYHDSNQYSEV